LLDRQLPTRHQAVDWGWHGLVLPLARILMRIPAFWSARHLIETAVESMRQAEARPMPWHAAEALAEFRSLRDQLEKRYTTLRDRFARDVWQASRPADAPIRGPLAALWWSLGDPWHAHGISDTGFAPTFSQVQQLLDRVLRRANLDPILSAVAERIWRVPGLSADRHQSVYRRMASHMSLTRDAADLNDDIWTGVSPAAAYSRALTSFFSGTLTSGEKATISAIAGHVDWIGGIPAIRFGALNLLLEPFDGDRAAERWHGLAERAAALALQENYRSPYSYDRSLDLPLYYLEGDGDRLFRAMERHRRASIDFVLHNVRPHVAAEPRNEALLTEEDTIVEEMRWLRHGLRLTRLAESAESSKPMRLDQIPADDLQAALDPDLALSDRRRRLDDILDALAAVSPGYVQSRAFEVTTVSDLALIFGRGLPEFPAIVPAGLPADAGDDSDPGPRIELAEALKHQAVRAADLGQPGRAVALYDELVARFGTSAHPALRMAVAEALTEKGVKLGRLGRPREELSSYQQVVTRFGSDPDPALRAQAAKALVNRAVTLEQLNRSEKALEAYDEILTRFGQDADPAMAEPVARAMLLKGVILSQTGRPEAALDVYAGVVTRFSEHSDPGARREAARALINTGASMAVLGRIDEELAAYDQVVAHFGEDPDPAPRSRAAAALLRKAATLRRVGKPRAAVAAYDDVIGLYHRTTDLALLDYVRAANEEKAAMEQEDP
jgi:tetratricopeptide (TPR) repeat protein